MAAAIAIRYKDLYAGAPQKQCGLSMDTACTGNE